MSKINHSISPTTMCFNGIRSESLNKTIKLTAQIIRQPARTSEFPAAVRLTEMGAAQQRVAAPNNP